MQHIEANQIGLFGAGDRFAGRRAALAGRRTFRKFRNPCRGGSDRRPAEGDYLLRLVSPQAR